MNNVTSIQMQKLLTGSHAFSMLAFSLLITRLKGTYKKEPTPENLQFCINEMNIFLHKYSSLMTEDLTALARI